MKLKDLVERIHVDPRKLTAYALNPKNERGRHKARVFRAVLGYTRKNYDQLLMPIEEQALDAEARLQYADAYGQRVQVD